MVDAVMRPNVNKIFMCLLQGPPAERGQPAKAADARPPTLAEIRALEPFGAEGPEVGRPSEPEAPLAIALALPLPPLHARHEAREGGLEREPALLGWLWVFLSERSTLPPTSWCAIWPA